MFDSGLTSSNLCSSVVEKLVIFEHSDMRTTNGSPLRSLHRSEVQMIDFCLTLRS